MLGMELEVKWVCMIVLSHFNFLTYANTGAAQPTKVILDSQLKKEVEKNRKLAPIIDSVFFLWSTWFRDDAKYHPDVGCYSTGGVGNFIELLNFRVRACDKVLEDYLKTCGKNRSYISRTSQNKIIKCCGQVISDEIIGDIKSSKFFLLLLMRLHTLQIESKYVFSFAFCRL